MHDKVTLDCPKAGSLSYLRSLKINKFQAIGASKNTLLGIAKNAIGMRAFR